MSSCPILTAIGCRVDLFTDNLTRIETAAENIINGYTPQERMGTHSPEVSPMQSNKTYKPVEQYLGYLPVIKGRSDNTIKEYRTDLLMFFEFVLNVRCASHQSKDFSCIDIGFSKTVTIEEIYGYIAYC
jgi:hypothetical protein